MRYPTFTNGQIGGFAVKFTVGAQWEKEFISTFAEMGVSEIFSTLRWPTSETGRGGITPPEVTRDHAKEYVSTVHDNGMLFCYAMNTSCLGNREYDSNYISQMLEEISFVDSIGADAISATVPFIIQMIGKAAPRLSIRASVMTQIDSIQAVRYFTEDLGVNEITLGADCNRNFPLLEAIRKSTDCPLELLANEDCLFHCPHRSYHDNMLSHRSALDDIFGSRYVDYCVMTCIRNRVRDHREIIKGRFIRPEDVHIYEDIGIDRIKISSRHLPREWVLLAAKAYAQGRYDGNLADIISPVTMSIPVDSMGRIEHWSEDEWKKFKRVVSKQGPNIRIDNRKLDGFLSHWQSSTIPCENTHCGEECNYCGEMADKAVSGDADTEFTANYIRLIDFMLDAISTGGLKNNPMTFE